MIHGKESSQLTDSLHAPFHSRQGSRRLAEEEPVERRGREEYGAYGEEVAVPRGRRSARSPRERPRPRENGERSVLPVQLYDNHARPPRERLPYRQQGRWLSVAKRKRRRHPREVSVQRIRASAQHHVRAAR